SRAMAQGPTLPGPGTRSVVARTTLGPIPGAGGQGGVPSSSAEDAGLLGGHPGVSVGRARRRSTRGPVARISDARMKLPQALPKPEEAPPSIPLALPGGKEVEGPSNGLTLDAAIERLVHENLDLRAQFHEIPMAEADVVTAGLRANPILYADSQLIP